MSTKKIREALERLKRCDIGVDEALAEVEAIEKAARDMRALAPGEVVDLFKENPKDAKVAAWLGGYEVLLTIAEELGK